MAIGSTLAIDLPAQPGTGYTWQSDPSQILRIEKKPPKSDDSLAGGWEIQRFEITAVAKGSANVTLRYRQPWVERNPSEKTFQIHVEITDPNVQ